METSFKELNQRITACRRCPRLVAFRENVPIPQEVCWRKPISGFGDENAWLLILGLAPSIIGANRTGRIFTGDASARFLIKALYQAGLTNQPTSESADDGLKLLGCYITPIVKCVPPQHRPLKEELYNCSDYFENEFFLLKKLRAVLALGQLAFDSYQHFLIKQTALSKRIPFSHGGTLQVSGWPTLFGSYHPSPQNTNTGKLTTEMLLTLLRTLQMDKIP